MKNYPLESDSPDLESDSSIGKRGGASSNANDDIPNGGFPPIYTCDKQSKNTNVGEPDKIKREYKTVKSTVSIKDILEKRRKSTPFI